MEPTAAQNAANNKSFDELVNFGTSSSNANANRYPGASGTGTGARIQVPVYSNGVAQGAGYGMAAPGGAQAYGRYPVQGGAAPMPNYGGMPIGVNPNIGMPPNNMGYMGGTVPVNSGNSVIAPGMLSPMVPRKEIPNAPAQGGKYLYSVHVKYSSYMKHEHVLIGNSGFSFLGGSPSGDMGGPSAPANRGSGADSFSFVTDAMKGEMKR
jgi:hypothetical protein